MSSALSQRLALPPSGVNYSVYQERRRIAVLPWIGPVSSLVAKWISRRMIPHFDYVAGSLKFYVGVVDGGKADLIHRCYVDPWSISDRPWIYEFDQSVGDQLRNYFNVPHSETRRVCTLLGSFLRQRRCRAVITWTDAAAKGMRMDYGLEEDRVEVIPPPMEVSRSRTKHDGINILHTTSQFTRKGTDTALEVLARLRKKYPDVRLLVAGEAEGAPFDSWKSRAGVNFLGLLTREDLFERIYPSTDLLFQPSRIDASPLAILEAMSFGIPIVTSSLTSLLEWIPESHRSLSRNPQDTEGFLEALTELLENADLRRQLGRDCRRLVQDRHDPRKIGARLRAAYEGPK